MSFTHYPSRSHNDQVEIQNEQKIKSVEIEIENAPSKHIKTHPIQIVENKGALTANQIKLRKCQLSFKPLSLNTVKLQDDDNSTFDTQNHSFPSITIPLSFFEQLVQQALQNKQIKMSLGSEVLINQDGNQKFYFELIGQLEQNKPSKGLVKDPSIEFLIMQQQKFVLRQNQPNSNLSILFQKWVSQMKLSSVDDIILMSHSNVRIGMTKEDLIIQQFRQFYHQQLIEYYRKQAFVDVMHSEVNDKQKCLQKIGEILIKLSKPTEYFYFNK